MVRHNSDKFSEGFNKTRRCKHSTIQESKRYEINNMFVVFSRNAKGAITVSRVGDSEV